MKMFTIEVVKARASWVVVEVSLGCGGKRKGGSKYKEFNFTYDSVEA